MKSLAEKKIDISQIQALYVADRSARALLDYLAERSTDIPTSLLEKMVAGVKGVTKPELVRVLKSLELLGCGRFIVGRKGNPSRFAWHVGRRELGQVAAGKTPSKLSETFEYKFHLRQGLLVTLRLPTDLSATEAERLTTFIRALVPEIV
jgi:hypothetical protein